MKKGLGILFALWVFWASPLQAARVVVLYPAASSVLYALGVSPEEVVGVTRHEKIYTRATKVGSHLRPNLELVRALKPDLVIVGSKKAFPEEAARHLGLPVFRYDPRTVREILVKVLELGQRLGREKRAQALVQELSGKLRALKPVSPPVRVIYEVSAEPLKVAGAKSIVNDVIRLAGGVNLIQAPRKHVLLSPEKVLALAPEVYLYQVGPMNPHPLPPEKRPYFRGLRSRLVQVEELRYARPGLEVFSAVLELNGLFLKVRAGR
ncbi:ABC transporter substrate-binding protein [Thermosulfurimonas marina]|uniref:ABC transporter substrate-binding protein n=1 Tax=Thermosulfurimonas marina TaxID=2047767 RepID=A0A6H1WTB7_9BACT|nr:ABC transporter substrate-binding protein [Thermosulfurimonas marina]QJA06432.1 ABC transporter substrate-binding protein [Thermosulfurimonas marina]